MHPSTGSRPGVCLVGGACCAHADQAPVAGRPGEARHSRHMPAQHGHGAQRERVQDVDAAGHVRCRQQVPAVRKRQQRRPAQLRAPRELQRASAEGSRLGFRDLLNLDPVTCFTS